MCFPVNYDCQMVLKQALMFIVVITIMMIMIVMKSVLHYLPKQIMYSLWIMIAKLWWNMQWRSLRWSWWNLYFITYLNSSKEHYPSQSASRPLYVETPCNEWWMIYQPTVWSKSALTFTTITLFLFSLLLWLFLLHSLSLFFDNSFPFLHDLPCLISTYQ